MKCVQSQGAYFVDSSQKCYVKMKVPSLTALLFDLVWLYKHLQCLQNKPLLFPI